MNERMRSLLVVVLWLTLLVSGCASVPMASLDEDAKAKSFAVPKGKSSIYVYRNETFGAAIPLTVALDGKLAGQTGPQSYFLWEVDPGPYEVSSVAENTSTLKMIGRSALSLPWRKVHRSAVHVTASRIAKHI